jgi:hypothetical protein
MTLSRRDVVCQCVGGAGAVVSCAGMILSLTAGLAGATGSALAQRDSMGGMGSMSGPGQGHAGTDSFLAFLNTIAVPLLLVSIVLMLFGVARAGWRSLGLVAIGSASVLINMFMPTSTWTAAGLLGGGYLAIFLGYLIAWRAASARRAASNA